MQRQSDEVDLTSAKTRYLSFKPVTITPLTATMESCDFFHLDLKKSLDMACAIIVHYFIVRQPTVLLLLCMVNRTWDQIHQHYYKFSKKFKRKKRKNIPNDFDARIYRLDNIANHPFLTDPRLNDFDAFVQFMRSTKASNHISYGGGRGYHFAKVMTSLNCDQIRSYGREFVKEFFRGEPLAWFISCGGNGSYTGPHDDPLATSRGFLAVLRGIKLVIVWGKESHRLDGFIEKSQTFICGDRDLADGFENETLSFVIDKFTDFNIRHKLSGRYFILSPGRALIFDATYHHAVFNFGTWVSAIAGEIWRSCESFRMQHELKTIMSRENASDRTGQTAHWVMKNWEKIEEQIRSEKHHDLGILLGERHSVYDPTKKSPRSHGPHFLF